MNGQAWSSASPRGQLRTRKMEETGCEIMWCPNNPRGKGIDDDDDDDDDVDDDVSERAILYPCDR